MTEREAKQCVCQHRWDSHSEAGCKIHECPCKEFVTAFSEADKEREALIAELELQCVRVLRGKDQTA